MTSPNQQPSKDWLDFCVTTRARARIRGYLRAEQRQKSIKLGQRAARARDAQRGHELHQARQERGRGASASSKRYSVAEPRRALARPSATASSQAEDVVDGMRGVKPERAATAKRPRRCARAASSRSCARSRGRDQPASQSAASTTCWCATPSAVTRCPATPSSASSRAAAASPCTVASAPRRFDTDPERRIEVSWDSKAKINRPVQLSVTTTNKPGILATVSQTFSDAEHQHQRGQLSRRRRRPRAQHLHLQLHAT